MRSARANKTTNHLGLTTTFYAIENLINGKIYIGQSVRYEDRVRSHLYKLRLDKHLNHELQSDFNRYGESSFVFKIIEVVDNLKRWERVAYEEKLIELNGSKIFGYNLLGRNDLKVDVKTKGLSFLISEDHWHALDNYIKDKDMKKSEWLNNAILSQMKEEGII